MLLHLFIHSALLGVHITFCLIFTFVLINEENIYWSLYVNKLKIDQCNNLCKAHACGEAEKGAAYLHIMQAWMLKLKRWLFGFQGKRLLQKMFQSASNLLDAEVVLNAQRWVHALTTSWPHTVIRQAVPFFSIGRKPRLGARLKLWCALVRPLEWGNQDPLVHCCRNMPLSIGETQKKL